MEKQIYKMKRYPAGYFAKIKGTEEQKQEVLNQLISDFGNESFATELVTKFAALVNPSSSGTSLIFPNGIYDVIYMENDITHKGGCVVRDPDTLEALEKYDHVCSDSICIIYDPDDGKYYNTSWLGYGSGHDRLYSFNENRALFLRPSMEPFYGLFPGIYEFPYCHRVGATLQWYGIYPTDIFVIDGEQYAVGYNNVTNEYDSRSTYLIKMFLYKLMLD